MGILIIGRLLITKRLIYDCRNMVSVSMISAKLSDLHDNITKLSHELDLKRKEKESQRSFVKKLDSEIKDKHRFLDSLEQKREQHEKAIRVNAERLSELQKSAAECQKAHESLEKRLESQEQSIRSLEDEVNEAQSLAKSSAQVYDETLKLLQEKLEILEKYDRKEESLTKTIKELREEANLHGNRLRRVEAQGDEANKRIEILEEKIRGLTEQINFVSHSCFSFLQGDLGNLILK
ncbi:unnamed protein product [Schistosoma rodhaini]|uniref:Myosin_tail_1 domain-containing protein n=1 Tax=Schistosoma rodhaini TaxID=6188 RepID=A0AA85FNJ5_9TREM|nr:unnamed protein product [Schistosoma rodhaini]